MTPTELSALRRLLFFSTAEAARWIARDNERPQGVEERTWNRWEAGQRPVPDNVAVAVAGLAEWRRLRIWELHDSVAAHHAAHHAAAQRLPLPLIWYAEADDWPGPKELWRAEQSTLAHVVGTCEAHLVALVPFDALAYLRWRQAEGRAEAPAAVAQWAATVVASARAGGQADTPTPPVLSVGGTPPVLSSLDD